MQLNLLVIHRVDRYYKSTAALNVNDIISFFEDELI
jgi:hypothetical protein